MPQLSTSTRSPTYPPHPDPISTPHSPADLLPPQPHHLQPHSYLPGPCLDQPPSTPSLPFPPRHTHTHLHDPPTPFLSPQGPTTTNPFRTRPSALSHRAFRSNRDMAWQGFAEEGQGKRGGKGDQDTEQAGRERAGNARSSGSMRSRGARSVARREEEEGRTQGGDPETRSSLHSSLNFPTTPRMMEEEEGYAEEGEGEEGEDAHPLEDNMQPEEEEQYDVEGTPTAVGAEEEVDEEAMSCQPEGAYAASEARSFSTATGHHRPPSSPSPVAQLISPFPDQAAEDLPPSPSYPPPPPSHTPCAPPHNTYSAQWQRSQQYRHTRRDESADGRKSFRAHPNTRPSSMSVYTTRTQAHSPLSPPRLPSPYTDAIHPAYHQQQQEQHLGGRQNVTRTRTRTRPSTRTFHMPVYQTATQIRPSHSPSSRLSQSLDPSPNRRTIRSSQAMDPSYLEEREGVEQAARSTSVFLMEQDTAESLAHSRPSRRASPQKSRVEGAEQESRLPNKAEISGKRGSVLRREDHGSGLARGGLADGDDRRTVAYDGGEDSEGMGLWRSLSATHRSSQSTRKSSGPSPRPPHALSTTSFSSSTSSDRSTTSSDRPQTPRRFFPPPKLKQVCAIEERQSPQTDTRDVDDVPEKRESGRRQGRSDSEKGRRGRRSGGGRLVSGWREAQDRLREEEEEEMEEGEEMEEDEAELEADWRPASATQGLGRSRASSRRSYATPPSSPASSSSSPESAKQRPSHLPSPDLSVLRAGPRGRGTSTSSSTKNTTTRGRTSVRQGTERGPSGERLGTGKRGLQVPLRMGAEVPMRSVGKKAGGKKGVKVGAGLMKRAEELGTRYMARGSA